jgi:D-glycero-D-manno-heptose 1,7-bisphosphate phosphatase
VRRRAFLLDRDGTVSQEVGYVNHPSRLALLPRAAEAIRRARDAGYLCVLVTNQAGVARGYFSEDLVHATHARLEELLAEHGTALDGIYYCPHHPSAGEPPYRADCRCRKPRPGMLLQAAADLDIDLSRSVVVGDKISDVEMAISQGARGILVRTGYGLGEEVYGKAKWVTTPDHIADDLLDAVRWVLEADHSRCGGTEEPS